MSKATNLADLDHKLTQWDGWVREYVSKFKGEGLSDKIKETAIRMMTPQGITDNRISRVREMNSYRAIRIMLGDLLQDKRENGGEEPTEDHRQRTRRTRRPPKEGS